MKTRAKAGIFILGEGIVMTNGLESDSTSSIGAAWPPAESTHNRIRGFYEDAVSTQEQLDVFLRHFDKAQAETAVHPVIDRLSIRAVVSSEIMRTMAKETDIVLEAAIPVRGEDLMVAYTGWNSASRRATDGKMSEHRTLLQTISTSERDLSSRLGSLMAKGFNKPAIIDAHTSEKQKAQLVGSFLELYGNFGYDEQDVSDLLMNPANSIVYVANDEGVVSTAMAERAVIELGNHRPIVLTEITEAFTRPLARNKGLYKDVSGHLIELLLDEGHEPIDVLYGESNLAMQGVVIAAHQNGRLFSHFDRDALGITDPNFGVLQQNFHITDGVEDRTYNDFAVSYVPLNQAA